MKLKNMKKAKKEDGEKEIKELQQQIEALSKEKDELFERLQRVAADYDNYQKRAPKQIADSVAYEKKAIIRSLLPSLDNFAHVLAIAQNAEAADGSLNQSNSVVKGVQMVFEYMLDALKVHGLAQIQAVGRPFDPNFHEAVHLKTEDDKPENVVLEEFQTGYTLNGQVIRPSKVIVNRLPAEDKEAETETGRAKVDDEAQEQTDEQNTTFGEE